MSIEISYKISPPDGVTSSVPPNATFIHDPNALRDAQQCLNAALTNWKDAIGDLEKTKEDPGKVAHGQGKVARMLQDSDSECMLHALVARPRKLMTGYILYKICCSFALSTIIQSRRRISVTRQLCPLLSL